MMTRSSIYKFSQGHPVGNSKESTPSTVMNSCGLSQETWWTPTSMLNPSLGCNQHTLCTSSIFVAALYEMDQPLLNPKLAKSTPRLGTWSTVFYRSTKAMNRVLLTAWDLSCSWRLKNMASGVPRASMKPNCMSSMLVCCRRKLSVARYSIFMTWSRNLGPR